MDLDLDLDLDGNPISEEENVDERLDALQAQDLQPNHNSSISNASPRRNLDVNSNRDLNLNSNPNLNVKLSANLSPKSPNSKRNLNLHSNRSANVNANSHTNLNPTVTTTAHLNSNLKPNVQSNLKTRPRGNHKDNDNSNSNDNDNSNSNDNEMESKTTPPPTMINCTDGGAVMLGDSLALGLLHNMCKRRNEFGGVGPHENACRYVMGIGVLQVIVHDLSLGVQNLGDVTPLWGNYKQQLPSIVEGCIFAISLIYRYLGVANLIVKEDVRNGKEQEYDWLSVDTELYNGYNSLLYDLNDISHLLSHELQPQSEQASKMYAKMRRAVFKASQMDHHVESLLELAEYVNNHPRSR